MPCPFCGSIKLAVCRHGDHTHVKCGECRGFGPPVDKKGASPSAAMDAWELRAPGPELAKKMSAPMARQFFKGKAVRVSFNRLGLSPCPFCGNAAIGFYEDGVLSYRMFAGCYRCGTEGPWANGRKDARIMWNQAHSRVKKWRGGWAKFLVEEKGSGESDTSQASASHAHPPAAFPENGG